MLKVVPSVNKKFVLKKNSTKFSNVFLIYLLFVVQSLSCVRLFTISGTAACQAPLSVGFPRQEYWSGLPFPSPGDLPHPGTKPRSPTLQADSLPSEPPGASVYIICVPKEITNSWRAGIRS